MTNIAEKTTRKPRAKTPIKIIVSREFVGDKSLAEVFIPVIVEDLRQKVEQGRTLDKLSDSA